MGTIGGPYVNGEYGTESVMNLGVVQVVDDVSDLQSGNLATPPDANVNDVNVPADRDGMFAVIRHTGDTYQRQNGAWVLIQRAPRYVKDTPDTLKLRFDDRVRLVNNTADTPAWQTIGSIGPFRFAGEIPWGSPVGFISGDNRTNIPYTNTEPTEKIKIVYKIDDNTAPNYDATQTAAANGYSDLMTVVRVGTSGSNYRIVPNLDTPSIEVLADCYVHLAWYAYNATGGNMFLGVANAGVLNGTEVDVTIILKPDLLQ